MSEIFDNFIDIQHFSCDSIKFSPDSLFLLASSYINIFIYDINDFEKKHTLKSHSNLVNDLNFSVCGKILASASMD
jgi:WD40 repeat protein